MGYESDQFYGLDTVESGEAEFAPALVTTTVTSVVDKSNNAFSYPDNTVRGGYRGKQEVWNEGTNSSNITSGYNFDLGVLKKGYIRSLKLDDAQSVVKCQFQFNPSTLNQSVSQNTQVLNFLQQNMSQYAQPMPSNVNFSFELFFDRSLELNHYAGAVEQGRDQGALWAKTDPSVVGVLHDIGTLYEVVGVGLSASQQDYMQATLEETIRAELLTASQEGDDSLSTVDDVNAAIEERSNQASSLLSVNQGNTAFLLPIPVRAVFSSLYIVEGLVQNISVRYLKFTRNLVPMQASVTITLEGKYIGFAKKNTFFTHVLEERRKLRAEEIAALNTAGQQNSTLKEIGQNDFSEIGVEIRGSRAFVPDNSSTVEDLLDGTTSPGFVDGRIRLYPNKGGFSSLKSWWATGKELTVSFSGTTTVYRIHRNSFVKGGGNALLTDVEATSEAATVESFEDKNIRLSKLDELTSFINSNHDAAEAQRKALPNNFGQDELVTDLLQKGYYAVDDDGFIVASAIKMRTDEMTPEPDSTSFSSYDEIREKFDDEGDFVSNEDPNQKTGHTHNALDAFNAGDEVDLDGRSQLKVSIEWLIVYDFKVELNGPDGARAVGVAKDYKTDFNHNRTTSNWDRFNTSKTITVDWGD